MERGNLKMKNYVKPYMQASFVAEDIAKLEDVTVPGDFEGTSIFDEAGGDDSW